MFNAFDRHLKIHKKALVQFHFLNTNFDYYITWTIEKRERNALKANKTPIIIAHFTARRQLQVYRNSWDNGKMNLIVLSAYEANKNEEKTNLTSVRQILYHVLGTYVTPFSSNSHVSHTEPSSIKIEYFAELNKGCRRKNYWWPLKSFHFP